MQSLHNKKKDPVVLIFREAEYCSLKIEIGILKG